MVEKDGTVRVRNFVDEKETLIPAGAKEVQFSANGRILLSISDSAVRPWDTVTGKPLCDPVLEPDGDPHAVLSPDGSRVVQWTGRGSSGQHAARLWDSSNGRIICNLAQHWLGTLCAAFSPDGSLVATGGKDHMLHLCDARTGSSVVPPMRHPQQVRECGFSADGLLIWVLADNDVVVWDTIAGEQVTPGLRHPRNPHFIAGSADARHIAVVGSRGSPRIWNLGAETLATADLQHIAHALSAHTLVPGSGSLRPLLPLEAQTAWEKARPHLSGWKEE
jgi:WD40 repeat protein